MKFLFKEIYEIYISNILISNNYFINLFVLGVIGYTAYKISYYIVGKLGFRNNIGSFFHWSIREIIFCALSSLIIFCIKIYNFVKVLSMLKKCFLLGFIIFVPIVIVKIKKAKKLNLKNNT